MMAVTEPGVHTISVMVSTQLLKTAFLENVFGYFTHLDPSPMLLLQPKEDAAEQFSKERISPMIKATPVLRDLVVTTKSRDSDNTLLYKAFPGGFLAMAGAGSPDNLARRPIRVLLADEVDKYPVTREGEPIAIAEERLATFTNWLSIRACSPTVEGPIEDGGSRIAACYEASDQRKPSVECPHCKHRQFLEFFKHVHWTKDEHGQHTPDTSVVCCESCGCSWSEGERLRSLQTIRWHQTRPFMCCGSRHSPLDDYQRAWRDDKSENAVGIVWDWWESDLWAVYRAKCPDCERWTVSNEHAGFQGGKLYSPWPKDQPRNIARKWLLAKESEDLKQVFFNTQLGLPYRAHSGKELKIESLAARGEVWADELPDGVALVTVGVDVQDYRIEIETVGWGRNEESWSIDYEVIDGEFSDPATQKLLDDYLKRIWRRGDGRGFEVMAACIDSGGHHTQAVYDFAKARLGRRIWAIKGESAQRGQRNPVWPVKRPTSKTKKTFRPVILGVNAAKDTIRSRLHLDIPGTAGYMHFPADRDINYYAQLTAERAVLKETSGQRYRVWELPPGKANEAIDCRVYAYAALCGLLHFGLKLNRRVEEVATPPENPIPREAQLSVVLEDQKPARKSLFSQLA